MDFNKDYYHILGLESSASKEEIKAAYRRLVKQHHPDRNPNDENGEEKIKDINEAYDLLYNDLTRHEYDAYRKQKEELRRQEEQLQQEKESREIDEKNKRTHVRTHTVYKEKRTYLKGAIIVKFWGELLDKVQQSLEREINYRIHPTDVTLHIIQTDIHPLDKAPTEYQQSYKESELFTTPLKQPINCVVQTAADEEHYALELKDIRVKSPTITNVTKHEGESFGTLTGELYAFVNEFIKEEYEVLETECFGDSGKVEFKEEEGQLYMRKEFFNRDCTTDWGPWLHIRGAATSTVGANCSKGTGSTHQSRKAYQYSRTTPQKSTPVTTFTEPAGCFQYWWIAPLIFLALAIPAFGLGIGIIAALYALFYILNFLFSRVRVLLAVLGVFFLASVIFAFIRVGSNPITVPRDTAGDDSIATTTQTVVRTDDRVIGDVTDTSQTAAVSQDTLINHFVRWRDYDSIRYEANLSVLLSELRSSAASHQQLRHHTVSGWQQVYGYLEQEDSAKLRNIYAVFDSIRTANGLDEKSFAHMVVSCIQSIPYYLVLDQSCNPAYYQDDEFVYNYLSTCNRDCCIGNISFGIASPVEFIANLKGDCDTRALLIYSVLKRFGYNIALLTSDYYKHALIAVAFSGTQPEGLAMNIRNKNYYLWETTATCLRPGFISPSMQNLRFWNISLLNEN